MRLGTNRLELDAPDHATWSRLLTGDIDGPAVEGYPSDGDVVMARLVVDGYLPAGEWGPWRIRLASTQQLIGTAGFKGAPSDEGIVEIGYGLAMAARGHGFATEAVLGLVGHARARGARTIIADTEPGNAASIAVLRRCGFHLSSRDDSPRDDSLRDDSLRDEAVLWWELALSGDG